MSAPITIKSVDDETANWISQEAERRGVDIQSLILDIFQKGIEVERRMSGNRLLDEPHTLAGGWTEGDAKRFLNAISDFEKVDEELWH